MMDRYSPVPTTLYDSRSKDDMEKGKHQRKKSKLGKIRSLEEFNDRLLAQLREQQKLINDLKDKTKKSSLKKEKSNKSICDSAGGKDEAQLEALKALTSAAVKQQESIAAHQEHIRKSQKELEAVHKEVTFLQTILAKTEEEVLDLEQHIEKKDFEIKGLQRELYKAGQRQDNLEGELRAETMKTIRLTHELLKVKREVASLEEEKKTWDSKRQIVPDTSHVHEVVGEQEIIAETMDADLKAKVRPENKTAKHEDPHEAPRFSGAISNNELQIESNIVRESAEGVSVKSNEHGPDTEQDFVPANSHLDDGCEAVEKLEPTSETISLESIVDNDSQASSETARARGEAPEVEQASLLEAVTKKKRSGESSGIRENEKNGSPAGWRPISLARRLSKRGLSVTSFTDPLGSDDDVGSHLSSEDDRVLRLEKSCKANEETISQLRSKMVRLTSCYKEEAYVNRIRMQKLLKENRALKAAAREKELVEGKPRSSVVDHVLETGSCSVGAMARPVDASESDSSVAKGCDPLVAKSQRDYPLAREWKYAPAVTTE